MIHTIELTSKSKPDELKKEFRRLAMTGGVVVRLSPDLSLEDLGKLVRRFLPLARRRNIAYEVLEQISGSELLPLAIREKVVAALEGEPHPGLAQQSSRKSFSLNLREELIQNTASKLRQTFLASLGDSDSHVGLRCRLVNFSNCPKDIVWLLGRDPSPQVRISVYERQQKQR
jgi:hypothetical protein